MPASDAPASGSSASALTFASCASFVPIGIANVLLGPLLPTLSARWGLNYSEAGALFTVQYVASTCAVALSGVLVYYRGFRFAMKAGLLLMAAGLAVLLTGSKLLGIVSIAIYGGGLGVAVPAANLLVAEVNSHRRSSALNTLNFCWSAGAVSCPFLVAAAAREHRVSILLALVAAFATVVAIGIAAMPAHVVEPAVKKNEGSVFDIDWKNRTLPILAVLFFLYVGTENGFGGWVATYAKSLGTLTAETAVMSASFFYAALTGGRLVAPLLLGRMDEVRLAKAGLVMSFVGMAGLILSRGLAGIAASACAAGVGMSCVYPITISLLSQEFGDASSRVGSVMFTAANIGGGIMPWIVGVASTQFGTLKAGLAVPLVGSAVMFALYSRNWKPQEKSSGSHA